MNKIVQESINRIMNLHKKREVSNKNLIISSCYIRIKNNPHAQNKNLPISLNIHQTEDKQSFKQAQECPGNHIKHKMPAKQHAGSRGGNRPNANKDKKKVRRLTSKVPMDPVVGIEDNS